MTGGLTLDTVVRVFFKLQSGLGPGHLRFDVAAFLAFCDEHTAD